MDKRYGKDSKWGEISSPSYYADKVECIDAMVQQFGVRKTKHFCLLNAFKYLWRCDKKHATAAEDIKKALWYLNKYLQLDEKDAEIEYIRN